MRKTSMYFVKNGHVIEGPYSLYEILELPLTRETFIWKEGTTDWASVTEFEEFSEAFDNLPPPIVIEFKKERKSAEETAYIEQDNAAYQKKSQIYFIHTNGETKGPYSIDELRALGLTKESLVWRDGMASWLQAAEIIELRPFFTEPAIAAKNQTEAVETTEVIEKTEKEKITKEYVEKDHERKDKVQKDETRKEHTSKKGGGLFGLVAAVLLCFILLLFAILYCRTHCGFLCSLNPACADTTQPYQPTPVEPIPIKHTPGKVVNTDSVNAAKEKIHKQILIEIARIIEANFKKTGGHESKHTPVNTEDTSIYHYQAYLSKMAEDIKVHYRHEVYTLHHIKNTKKYSDRRYSAYVDYITAMVNSYFKERINSQRDTGNLYDRTYLDYVNTMHYIVIEKDHEVIKYVQKKKKHHPKIKPHQPRHHDCCRYMPEPYIWYPSPMLGHYAYEIENTYSSRYLRYDFLHENFYTIVYENADMQAVYTIDATSKRCTKFTIRFYNGKYYNGYLRRMFSESSQINGSNQYWMSSYENRDIEIDLQYAGYDCIQELVYYFF